VQSDQSVIEDYRECSYKDRLRILRDLEQGSPFDKYLIDILNWIDRVNAALFRKCDETYDG